MNTVDLAEQLAAEGYIASEDLGVTLQLAMQMQKPLLLEGVPGVGKTSIAGALATSLETELIRLQCYEGLDAGATLYEWNHAKQILDIRIAEASGKESPDIFSRDYLLARPLLQAIDHKGDAPAVLLIDEIDRADEEFEAFLLEVLSEYQITIPELGSVKAVRNPIVILTSNCTRELSDALRRRCLYLYLELPSVEQEAAIIRQHLPDIDEALSDRVMAVVNRIRQQDLDKPPGISESLDWARALQQLGIEAAGIDAKQFHQTKSCLLKSAVDVAKVSEAVDEILTETNHD